MHVWKSSAHVRMNVRHCLVISITTIFLLPHLCIGVSANNDTLYPFGLAVGDRAAPTKDDDCTSNYTQRVNFFGKNYSTIYVCTNGAISLDKKYKEFKPYPFPLKRANVALICPFWADVDLCRGGRLWTRETTDQALLQRASLEVRDAYRLGADATFTATWLLIATWYDVRAYNRQAPQCPLTTPEVSPGNTFQAVIASNGIETFVMFNYRKIQWYKGSVARSQPAQVGFDSGDGVNYYATPQSRTTAVVNIATDSNTGAPGKMVFKLGKAGTNVTKIVLPDKPSPPTTPSTTTISITTVLSTTSTSQSTVTKTNTQTTSFNTSPSTAAAQFNTTSTISPGTGNATSGIVNTPYTSQMASGRNSLPTAPSTTQSILVNNITAIPHIVSQPLSHRAPQTTTNMIPITVSNAQSTLVKNFISSTKASSQSSQPWGLQASSMIPMLARNATSSTKILGQTTSSGGLQMTTATNRFSVTSLGANVTPTGNSTSSNLLTTMRRPTLNSGLPITTVTKQSTAAQSSVNLMLVRNTAISPISTLHGGLTMTKTSPKSPATTTNSILTFIASVQPRITTPRITTPQQVIQLVTSKAITSAQTKPRFTSTNNVTQPSQSSRSPLATTTNSLSATSKASLPTQPAAVTTMQKSANSSSSSMVFIRATTFAAKSATNSPRSSTSNLSIMVASSRRPRSTRNMKTTPNSASGSTLQIFNIATPTATGKATIVDVKATFSGTEYAAADNTAVIIGTTLGALLALLATVSAVVIISKFKDKARVTNNSRNEVRKFSVIPE